MFEGISSGLSAWQAWAISQLRAEEQRVGESPLVRIDLEIDGIQLYLKDESVYPTASLKHRLARFLFIDAIVSGALAEGGTAVDTSSGSTAVAEAYFARLLGIDYVAVIPESTSPDKIEAIREWGGRCHLVPSGESLDEAVRELLSSSPGATYLDQFANASRVTDWSSTASLPGSILRQLRLEASPVPFASVMGLGTGGTCSSFGRHWRSQGLSTLNIGVDPEGSVLGEYWRTGDASLTSEGSLIEGIGRPRVVESVIRSALDEVVPVTNEQCVRAMDWLGDVHGVHAGPSTGGNVWVALQIARFMQRNGLRGSLVSVICDSGDRYAQTFYDTEWRVQMGLPSRADSRVDSLAG